MDELRFGTPWLLLLAPAAVLAAGYLARRRRRSDSRLVLPLIGDGLGLPSSAWVRLDRAIPWLRGAVLLLLVLALARPQAGARLQTTSSDGVDIVVALDVSTSMQAEDFRPRNRLEVARNTVREFVVGRPLDRLGLVIFAGLATTRCPLTQDHDMLLEFLGDVDFASREEDGTAMGMGLATALNRLRETEAKSKVVVLVTDGRNNRGEIAPEAAAEAARALGVRVYTIGVGSDEPAPFPQRYGPSGVRYVMQQLELDEELLQAIAEKTGGQYFRATDAEGLRRIFARIDELEKTEVRSRERVLYSEWFHLLLWPALGLLLLERLLLATRLRRIP